MAVASSVETSQVVECSDQECPGVPSVSRELEGDLWHAVERVGGRTVCISRELL